jgi:3-hydroxybutyryl-CoA dehydratase
MKGSVVLTVDLSLSQIKIGDKAELSKTINDKDVYNFAKLSMDFNPIHVNKDYASNTIFKKRIVHGMLSASLISAVIGTKLPGQNTIYLEQKLKFIAPVFIGQTITAQVTVKEKNNKGVIVLKTEVINQNGQTVIEGEATVMKK